MNARSNGSKCPRLGVVLLALFATLACLVAVPGNAAAQVGISALPSLYELPWLERPARRLRIAADVGYGGFGDILGAKDVHHRVLGGIGGAFQTGGFGVEARMDARYDKHKLQGDTDSGAVLDPRLALRFGRPVAEKLSLGAQLGLWFPGKEFPKPAFPATTVDLLGLATVHASEGTDLVARIGYRIDQSDQAVDHPERLSASDFAAIGLSSFNAVLVGLGLRHDFGDSALIAELASDVLVGSGAPSFGESPSHLGAGADVALGDGGTRLRVMLNAALSGRPPVDVTGPLVPLLPRVWFLVGLTQDALTEKAPVAEPVVEETTEEPAVEEPSAEPLQLPEQPRGVIRVIVRDTDWGEPLEASITVVSPQTTSGEAPAASGRTTRLSEGMLELPVAPGRYEVLIEAKGYSPQRRTIVVDEGGVTVLNVDLRPKEKS